MGVIEINRTIPSADGLRPVSKSVKGSFPHENTCCRRSPSPHQLPENEPGPALAKRRGKLVNTRWSLLDACAHALKSTLALWGGSDGFQPPCDTRRGERANGCGGFLIVVTGRFTFHHDIERSCLGAPLIDKRLHCLDISRSHLSEGSIVIHLHRKHAVVA